MTQYSPTFNVSEFELRNYTNPYLTPAQQTAVTSAEERVEGQLDFLAQMLGWSGPQYWGNLPNSVNQKRQLLGGTYGVYNSYVIPTVYQIRNWDNTIVIDKVDFLIPGRQTNVVNVKVGESTYQIQSVFEEGDRYVVSIGDLTDEFFSEVESGTPIQVNVPTFRPAPFTRQEIGISGDASFVCRVVDGSLVLYPGYDAQGLFPVEFPILFRQGVYRFNKPVYLATDSSTLQPVVSSEYSAITEQWVLRIDGEVGLSAFLVLANYDADITQNPYLGVTVVNWADPSDWGTENVLDNYKGVWNNKGGDLPFNFVFDALSLHGFSERDSIYLAPISYELNYDEIVNYIYYQKTTISSLSPPGATAGDLWWNDVTGALSVWLPDAGGCGAWVEINYRQSPTLVTPPTLTFTDVITFRAAAPTITPGTIIRIDDITGLDVSDNVIGIGGAINSPAAAILHLQSEGIYWEIDELFYADVTDFEADATNLPYRTLVRLYDATGLAPSSTTYSVSNLPITISGDYEVILQKFYRNDNWEIFPDSILKYIAFSSLFTSPEQGEMWWDFVNTDPDTRAAALYYQSAWVSVNSHPQSGPPATPFNMGTILFYADGVILSPGQDLLTDNYVVSYTEDIATGTYTVNYNPRNFLGRAQLPTITISDSITTTYRADISNLVFSGITYRMSPNVYNSETPLRLWKGEALQCANTVEHLEENNYINPLRADLNTGPGPENWEKYFVRLPLEYERNGEEWQKVALICQDFAYFGSTTDPEQMRCPPEDDLPAIYEELFLYGETSVPDYTYVYCEPYLYSNIAFSNNIESGRYQNAGIFPTFDLEFDEFDEAVLTEYAPLHNRLADTTSPVGNGYGDWEGVYVNINECVPLVGFLETDLLSNGVTPVTAPVWDASIYKFAPTCQNDPASYDVDANHYKICYSYFVADASAAEDPFFDIHQESAWRYPVTLPRTSYLTPR